MIKLQLKNKLTFFNFVKGNSTLQDIEYFISNTLELEQELGTDVYIELLHFDFRDKNASNHLKDFLFEKVIFENEYETWELTKLLQDFIDDPIHAKELLDTFYRLYCSTYNRQGEFTNGYRFLGHLGLNYFYWMDKSYLQTNYGDKWLEKYNNSLNQVEFYHTQLKPIAEQILEAIEHGEIQIQKKENTKLLKG